MADVGHGAFAAGRSARMVEENGYPFPIVFDEQDRALVFEIRGSPATFSNDGNGLTHHKRQGFKPSGHDRGATCRVDALCEYRCLGRVSPHLARSLRRRSRWCGACRMVMVMPGCDRFTFGAGRWRWGRCPYRTIRRG
ncbi:hypothetical protein [Candidatus Palauibacter sp.]|uniref:hypothetical protein n=1 Tax=Candidatus Palauibacter sp. TaxID=3101350 RepID=UPI003C6EDEFC